ncbi:MAG: hypothetical protein HRT36_07085 [Alphaproteobacteria bacterium]|nr:hypothetical protein [Alphaproteobacteria bacterium]
MLLAFEISLGCAMTAVGMLIGIVAAGAVSGLCVRSCCHHVCVEIVVRVSGLGDGESGH